MITIIYAHPWAGSFNKAILTTLTTALEQINKKYTIIDLNKEGFDPTFRKESLELYAKGETEEQLVKKYQAILLHSSELYFIFPIWWYTEPAILKGFIEKVMLPNFAYTKNSLGMLKGTLSQIKKATVITTAQSPKWYLKYFAGNYISGVLLKRTFKDLGFQKTRWLHLGSITTIAKTKRVAFLNKVSQLETK